MSPPGRNANGRSLRGRKQIQSSPQSLTDIYFAQASREQETYWRAIVGLQLFILLAQSLARVQRQLFGQAAQQTLSIIDNSLALIRRAESDLTNRRNETKKTKNHSELNGNIPHL